MMQPQDQNDMSTRVTQATDGPNHGTSPATQDENDIGTREKEFRTQAWVKKSQAPHNHKTNKKKKWLRAKNCKHKTVQPHADDAVANDEESDQEFIPDSMEHEPAEIDLQREERNILARAVLDAKPPSLSEEDSNELTPMLEMIQDIVGSSDDSDLMNEWVSHLENVVIMSFQVMRAQSFADVFVAIAAYIKMNTKNSVLKQILELIDEVTKKCPATEVDVQAWEADDVLKKWDLFKTNTVFTKVSYLLTAAMSLSVCSIKQIEWSPFGLQLVSLEAAKQQLKAVDVIDAAIKTFTWVADTGYRVFEEKSLMPLLYSDAKMQKFNEDCDYVLAHAEHFLAGNGGEINDFDHKVDNVLQQVCEMKKVKDTGPTALWLQQRYSQLVNIKQRIIGKHRNTAIRFAPFGVGITGASGVGKSTLAKIVMKTCLNAMGFSYDSNRIITKDMFDKYDSTYTTDILGMFMDDVGAGKVEFTVVSPTDIIIKFFNNMAAQAVKAELNAKGIVFIDFKVGVLTSNFIDYNVCLFANKPEAALRRFVHTRVRVQQKYRKPGSVSLNTDHPELVGAKLTKDVWNIDLEECFIYENKEGREFYKFRIMQVQLPGQEEPYDCIDMSLKEYLTVLVHLAQKHSAAQTNVISRSKEFDEMIMCPTCKLPTDLCSCNIPPIELLSGNQLAKKLEQPYYEETDNLFSAKREITDEEREEWRDTIDPDGVEPHGMSSIGDVVVGAMKQSAIDYVNRWMGPVALLNSMLGYKPIKSLSTWVLSKEMYPILHGTATPWIVALTPEWIFESKVFHRTMTFWRQSAVWYDLRYHYWIGSAISCGLVGLSVYSRNRTMICGTVASSWIFSMGMWAQHRERMKAYQDEYLKRRDALPAHAKALRDGRLVKGAFIVSTLVVGLKLFRLWNSQRIANSKAEATEPNAVNMSDDQPGWFGSMMTRMGITLKTPPGVSSMSAEQMASAFKKNNLFWAAFEHPSGKIYKCNIYFPMKGVACFPKHMFHEEINMTKPLVEKMKVTVYRHDGPGGVFRFEVHSKLCVMGTDLDIVVCDVKKCPDLITRIGWLPLSHPVGLSTCNFLCRDLSVFRSERVSVQYGKTAHKYLEFLGGSYTTKNAKKGSCMGLLITETKNPVVVGFHIGGNPDQQYGVMQTVTQGKMKEMIRALSKLPGVMLPAEATTLPTTQYNRVVLPSTEVHPHCMASKLDSKAFVDVLGSTQLRTVQKSSVEKSMLSDAVAKICDVPNIWDKPALLPNWRAFNATLEHIVNPNEDFDPLALEEARQDYLSDLKPLMLAWKVKEGFRPLSEREMILGVPGKRFLDAIPMDTGCGYPVFGPKARLFEEIRDGEKLVDRIPVPLLREEMERLLSCWKSGKRGYPVFTATLKDEPTKIGKDKVRVFQAAPVAFGLWIRKYFLPIARFLSMHPEVSESAVGVNAFSYQWEELMNHAEKYDANEALALDHAKYDVSMSSQITTAVLLSYIELAEIGGYSEEDLHIMRMLATDLVHPLLDYNGTLLEAYGMNTSGNNITVNINSSAGSIYVRLGFFACTKPAIPKPLFRDCVAIITYGDDLKGSVKEEYRKDFNFETFRVFLARYGMVITVPDKSSDTCLFLKNEEADFLKRNSSYIPEIGCKIGALDEMSIFKSLHANVRSKEATQIEVAISCVEGAMHEWFAHGRETYESRRMQMEKVCEQHELKIPAVGYSFDDRVKYWQSKYCKTA
jgi:ABC-type oligopeptide transport system ATPase subunit